MLPSNARRPGQARLDGLEAPPTSALRSRPTDRLFFALYPDAACAMRIVALAERLRAEYRLTGRAFAAERLHVTLLLVGDFIGLPARQVDTACEAAAALAMPPVEVAFDRAASFDRKLRNRPFVLQGGDGVAALAALQQAFAVTMAAASPTMAAGGSGRREAPAPSTPHMTLLYDDRCVAPQAVEPIRWTAHEFVLVHSLLGKSRHVPLAKWALGG